MSNEITVEGEPGVESSNLSGNRGSNRNQTLGVRSREMMIMQQGGRNDERDLELGESSNAAGKKKDDDVVLTVNHPVLRQLVNPVLRSLFGRFQALSILEKRTGTIRSLFYKLQQLSICKRAGALRRRIRPRQWIAALRSLGRYDREDWKDNLDDVIRFGLGFGTWALLGITLGSFRSIDGKDRCEAGPEEVRTILATGGFSFALLTGSAILASVAKTIGKKITNEDHVRLKNGVFRTGMLISSAFCSVGIVFLGVYFADLFEVRLGDGECGGRWSSAMTNMFMSWGAFGGCLLLVAALFAFFTG